MRVSCAPELEIGDSQVGYYPSNQKQSCNNKIGVPILVGASLADQFQFSHIYFLGDFYFGHFGIKFFQVAEIKCSVLNVNFFWKVQKG